MGHLAELVTMEVVEADGSNIAKLARISRSLANKATWKRRMQRRCAILARALRHAEKAVGSRYISRERTPDGTWTLFAGDGCGEKVAVMRIAASKELMCISDFKKPIMITVIRPEMVQMRTLKTLVVMTSGIDQTAAETEPSCAT